MDRKDKCNCSCYEDNLQDQGRFYANNLLSKISDPKKSILGLFGMNAAPGQKIPLFPAPILKEPVLHAIFLLTSSPLASKSQAEQGSYVPRLPGTTLYSNMPTEGKLLRDLSNPWTSSMGRLLFVLHYHLFTLFSLFCWQSPAEVTVSQPTHTANGTNGWENRHIYSLPYILGSKCSFFLLMYFLWVLWSSVFILRQAHVYVKGQSLSFFQFLCSILHVMSWPLHMPNHDTCA